MGGDDPVAVGVLLPTFSRDASWLGQPTAAGGERSGMKSSPQSASNSILILHAAWCIDTWAEHMVKIRAMVGDLDKQVTLTEFTRHPWSQTTLSYTASFAFSSSLALSKIHSHDT